jgi:DNA topoisomerase-2
MLERMKQDLLILGAKYYFVKGIVDDVIIVNKKTKDRIIEQIKATNNPVFENLESFDFLLNLPIHSMSKETFEELKNQIEKKKLELTELEKLSEQQIWKSELSELKNELEKSKWK